MRRFSAAEKGKAIAEEGDEIPNVLRLPDVEMLSRFPNQALRESEHQAISEFLSKFSDQIQQELSAWTTSYGLIIICTKEHAYSLARSLLASIYHPHSLLGFYGPNHLPVPSVSDAPAFSADPSPVLTGDMGSLGCSLENNSDDPMELDRDVENSCNFLGADIDFEEPQGNISGDPHLENGEEFVTDFIQPPAALAQPTVVAHLAPSTVAYQTHVVYYFPLDREIRQPFVVPHPFAVHQASGIFFRLPLPGAPPQGESEFSHMVVGSFLNNMTRHIQLLSDLLTTYYGLCGYALPEFAAYGVARLALGYIYPNHPFGATEVFLVLTDMRSFDLFPVLVGTS